MLGMSAVEKDGAITPKEFNEWLKNNIKYTWNLSKEGGFFRSSGGTPIFKYFYPKLDTRDMMIFRIDFKGSLEETHVDFRDCEKDENILDLLNKIIDKYTKD
jgi:hypothetical protein